MTTHQSSAPRLPNCTPAAADRAAVAASLSPQAGLDALQDGAGPSVGEPALAAVAMRPGITPFDEVFERYIRTDTPVVLARAATSWPACQRWTPEFLCERYGSSMVELIDADTGEHKVRALADYFALPPAEQSRWFLCEWNFRQQYPELMDDLRIPPQFDVDWIADLPTAQRPDLHRLHAGHAGSRGATHVDAYGTSAWLAVLQGHKRVRFAKPRRGRGHELRSLNLFDDATAGRVAAELSEARLQAGDVLFVPAGCWHAVLNDSYSLSVAANFIDGANFCQHRRFETRQWQGWRMLVAQLNRLRSLPPGPQRDRLTRHLSLAIERLANTLHAELAELGEVAGCLEDVE